MLKGERAMEHGTQERRARQLSLASKGRARRTVPGLHEWATVARAVDLPFAQLCATLDPRDGTVKDALGMGDGSVRISRTP